MNQQLNRFSLTVEEVYKIKTSPNLIVIGQIDSGQINVNEEIYCYRSTADKKYMRVTEIKRKGLSVAWAQSGDKIIICLEGSNLTKEDVHNGDILFKRQKWDEKQKVEETVELLVVAPMSSGKSTVINAILGMNILPSSNFACTAHKYKITINDKNEQVEVSVRVRNGKMEKVTDVNGETLKKINEDEISKEINIEAPSYGRLAQTRKIVLIDTPGANYSGNSSHRAVTDSIISEFSGNAVLYILNASQIGTEDDEKILKKIKGLLDKNKDMEIIFALNKADVINRDKESLDTLIRKQIVPYIKKVGINRFSIYPCSAEAALLFRRALAEDEMAESEADNFYKYFKYFYRDTISLYQYIYDSDREAEYETIEVDGEPYSRKSVEIALYNTGLQELENKLVKLGKSEEKGKTETLKDEIAKMNEIFADVSIV